MTVLVGSVHSIILGAAIGALFGLHVSLLYDDATFPFVIVYLCVALLLVFYPVSGFLADVYCGRRNVIFTSLCLILCSLASLLVVILPITYHRHFTTTAVLVSCFGLLLAIIGIAGYGANFIQFGLDHLLEAPSQDQALFVHWAKWCYDCLSAIFLGIFGLEYCNTNSDWIFKWAIIFSIVLVFVCVLLLLTVLSCWKRHLLYTETRCHNPYKVVVNVLHFAWKHKYPLQRSAFSYCDDERPSRLDFAKERFGGPVSTEKVEEVMVLLRIVLILLAIGPMFSMDLLINNFSLASFGLHVGSYQSIQRCPWSFFMTNVRMLQYTVSTLIFPAYMWIVFRCSIIELQICLLK